MKREDVLNLIKKTYERAMRTPTEHLVIYKSGETGDFYQFCEVAGGNNEPENAWNGKDIKVCDFCFIGWCPEDTDEDFREHLLDYLDKSQREQVRELSGHEIAEMFPSQYDEYCEDIIQRELVEFSPEDILDNLE